MGYDVHITRKDEWPADSGAGSVISLEEWLQYVASDSEMRVDGFAEITTDSGTSIRIENPGATVWLVYSKGHAAGASAWLCHHKDRITAKNPDKEILAKMYRIAEVMKARVQGDEGELYGADGELILASNKCPIRVERSWRRLW